MRALVQRVESASVSVAGETVGAIGSGLLILVGVTVGDTEDDARMLAEKTVGLRIFGDESGKMNRSLKEVGGSALVVSQFTLYGDSRKGRRPSFTRAAPPEVAEGLVKLYAEQVESHGVPVAHGHFGAHMKVALVNDGPVTLLLESGPSGEPARPH